MVSDRRFHLGENIISLPLGWCKHSTRSELFFLAETTLNGC